MGDQNQKLDLEISRYLREWPEVDRARWQAALSQTAESTLDLLKVAVSWRKQSFLDYTVGYTHGLRWLSEAGHLRPRSIPEDRWNQQRLFAYVTSLAENGYKSSTIHTRLITIERVLTQIAPQTSTSFIHQQLKKLSRRSPVDEKRERLVASWRLRELGKEMMDQAQGEEQSYRSLFRYRTGLQIALLAARPIRMKNFASLALGRHIKPKGAGYWIEIPSDEMKKNNLQSFQFPQDLVSYFEYYLAVVHPALLGGVSQVKYIWPSSRKGPLGANGIYKRIMAATEKQLGKAINPHLFRDCLATSLVEEVPSEWDTAHLILGNTIEVTDRVYNQATTLEAGRRASEIFKRRGR